MTGSIIKFIKIDGSDSLIILVVFFTLSGLFALMQDVWLGWWSSDFLQIDNKLYYFEVLILISIFNSIYILVRTIMYTKMMRAIGMDFFSQTIKKMLRASVAWYEIFTVPRILYSVATYQ